MFDCGQKTSGAAVAGDPVKTSRLFWTNVTRTEFDAAWVSHSTSNRNNDGRRTLTTKKNLLCQKNWDQKVSPGKKFGSEKILLNAVWADPLAELVNGQEMFNLVSAHALNWLGLKTTSCKLSLKQATFKKWAIPGLLFFTFNFSIVKLVDKILLTSGFKPHTSGVGSSHSTNWATTTAQN